jgi:glycosyltransferase involved in cell wall biosynthesis
MKKILICGNSLNQASGLSYVSSSITSRLIEAGYEVGYATISGAETTSDGAIVQGERFTTIASGKLALYTAILNGQNPIEKFNSIIESFSPDIVLSIHDPWWYDCIAFSTYRTSYTWIAMPTIESPEYPKEVMFHSPLDRSNRKNIFVVLSAADAIIPCSTMGRDCLRNMELTNVLEPIPHGLDLDDRVSGLTKSAVFDGMMEDSDFLLMTMGLNTDRKKIESTVLAFHAFIEKMNYSPKYKLYIHTDTEVETGGSDLKGIVRQLNLQDHVLIPNNVMAFAAIPKNELYKRYSVCDAYIGLPGGEGFGYGFAEAIMHGKPIIYGTHGAHREFCTTCGIPVSPSNYFYAKNGAIRFALYNPDDGAKAIAKMVSDPKLREGLTSKTEGVTSMYFNWDNNMKKLISTFEDVDSNTQTKYKHLPIRRLI